MEEFLTLRKLLHNRMVTKDGLKAIVVPIQIVSKLPEKGIDKIFRNAGFEWRSAGCSMFGYES